jgi:hypothetical protein
MGGVRSFRIESNRFDLIREGDSIDSVSLFESGRHKRHSVCMGKEGAQWLGQCIEENIVRETEHAFIRTFRESDKGYVIRRFTNKYGRYLEITDYGRGGCKGRLAIPEGQKQSGLRGFHKELLLLLNPTLVDNKNQNRHGYKTPADENNQKRIPIKERLGPMESYAESLRAPATQHQAANGRPLISQNPISKLLKNPKITQAKVIVNENEEGKATLKEKFLGFIPYRRIGKDMANKSSPKLMISCNVDGKHRVTWGRQASRGEVASTKEETHYLGQVVKQPNSLVQEGPEETFSGPSHFEWGETSTS